MKNHRQRYVAMMLVMLLSGPWQIAFSVKAQTLKQLRTNTQKEKPSKLAPDLEEILSQDDEEQRQLMTGKTLAQVRQERRAQSGKTSQQARAERTKVNNILLPSSDVLAEEKQSFIVQLDGTTPKALLQEKVARLGGTIRQSYTGMGLVTIEAPRTVIRQLAADNSIAYVSPDRPVAASGHLTRTTGAEQIRTIASGLTLDGSGIGVAVIDSALLLGHALLGTPTIGDTSSTIQNCIYKSFISGDTNLSVDNNGHGTHVASLIAGRESFSSGYYTGIAPGVKLLGLRALDDNGAGSASSVIAAIDWCITNKATYNIRVMNLSLGTLAKDSYKTDPLCLAARRAVNAGIVVVAAAGNSGKNANNGKVYGTIHSPGSDPSVITVGAANTFGTDSRLDDQVATYSSRGPTRGYTTVNGVRNYDNLIKPDLIAPGNKLIGAQGIGAYDKGFQNQLARNYPTLKVKDSVVSYNSSTGSYSINGIGTMYLSGTSMSAPVVAGAAALLLQANPSLTPNLVKAILMYTAQPLKGFNMLEQGAGLLNIDGAVRLARLIKSNASSLSNGTAMLTATLPAQQSTIAGQTFKWGQGIITNYGFLFGSDLMNYWQGVYGTGMVLGDATVVANGVFSKVTGKASSGVSLKAGAINVSSDGMVLSDGTILSDSTILANGLVLSDGMVLSDGVLFSDGMILSDGTTRADTVLKTNGAVVGDSTKCMQPAP